MGCKLAHERPSSSDGTVNYTIYLIKISFIISHIIYQPWTTYQRQYEEAAVTGGWTQKVIDKHVSSFHSYSKEIFTEDL